MKKNVGEENGCFSNAYWGFQRVASTKRVFTELSKNLKKMLFRRQRSKVRMGRQVGDHGNSLLNHISVRITLLKK